MIFATFQVTNTATIPLTPQESELHEALKNIIVSAQQDAMFSFQDVTALQFEELAEPHKAQFVEGTAEDEEDNYEDIACVPEEEDSVIDLDYKTRAVDYWKSDAQKVLIEAAPTWINYRCCDTELGSSAEYASLAVVICVKCFSFFLSSTSRREIGSFDVMRKPKVPVVKACC
ncbi:hypothetical protein Trydic_g5768 [Trypoxylus dichotomus]